jgi:hypothetical protein
MCRFIRRVLSIVTCDFAFYRQALRGRAVEWFAALLAITLLFAAGFSIVRMHLVRNGADRIVKASTNSRNSTMLTAGHIPASLMARDIFPQFSTSGTILQGYTPGASLWPRSVFDATYGSQGLSVSDMRAAAGNAWEDGGLYPYFPNTTSWNCGTGGSWSLSCFHTNWENTVWNSYLSAFNSSHIPFVITTDDLVSYPSYAYPAYVDMSQSLESQGVPIGMFIGQLGPDEYVHSVCSLGNMIDGFGLGFTGDSVCGAFTPTGISSSPFAHIAYGPEPFPSSTYVNEWLNEPTAGDFNVLESGGGPTSLMLGNALNDDNLFASALAARGPVPGYITSSCMGPAYYKKTNDTQYTPGVDIPYIVQSGDQYSNAASPGAIADVVFFAVAHGYAGIRTYAYDIWASGRRTDPICPTSDGSGCNLEQTGCGPIAANAYGVLGQDRWYALSAAYNVVKMLEPYILQPAMTAPVCTAPVICGAKQGNGGRLVVFVNFSDNSNSVAYNPSPYLYAAGTAQSWKIIGSSNRGCGAESTLPSVNDCGIGPTTINGVTWTQGTAMPAPGTAPITMTTLTMQPLEIDVFLYQQ